MACANFECKALSRRTLTKSVTQGERNLVSRNRPFAKDHPRGSTARDIDDGRRDGTRRRAAVDNQRDLVAELLPNAVCIGAFGHPREVGGGGGNRKAQPPDNSAGYSGLGNTQGDVAGIRSHPERKLGTSAYDESKRARPETLGETLKRGVKSTGEFVRLRDFADEQRKRLMASTRLKLVDAIDSAKIYRIDSKAIEGVRGKSNHLARMETISYLGDELWFGLIGVDTKRVGRQNREAPVPCAALCNIAYRWNPPKAMDHIKTA